MGDASDDGLWKLHILQYRLPRLCVERNIENCLEHGMGRTIGKGRLRVRIGVSDERWRIRISDDGMGMKEETLKLLNDKLRRLTLDDVEADNEKKGGIALLNVNNRIKLLFGEEFGITFYSKEGVGTDVLIVLPLKRV